MIRGLTLAIPALLVGAGTVSALELSFPGPANQTFLETSDFVSYKLPIGAYQDGLLPTLVAEGAQTHAAWRVESPSGTTLGVADSLRQQIEAVGFELLYECETKECGGFDFRFETKVLSEPIMHVDLGDFRFLAAQRLGQAVPEYLSLFISRSDQLAYVQMILVGGEKSLEIVTSTQTPAVRPNAPTTKYGTLIEDLERNGSAVLKDLVFATGSSALENGDFQTLDDLSEYLKANPERTVALVGHTDSEGSLSGNIALSRKRAQSVAGRLIRDYGVSANQVEADGVGYLAPVANNLTEEGRTKNRRVEVILTSTQ